MKSKIILAGFAALLMSAWAQADSHGTAATIRLMELADGGLPEAVTKDIELPAAAEDSEAVANAVDGLETAADNLQQRDAGIETAQQALLDALANQESRGRSSENIPESRPEPAGPP